MPDIDSLSPDNDAQIAGEKLFAETIAAHGGDAFLTQTTLKITGKGEFTTPPQTGGLKIPLSSFTLYVAAGGRTRLEARSPGGSIVFVSRGNGKGGFFTLVGRTQSLPAEQADGLEVSEFLRMVNREDYLIVAIPEASVEKTADGKDLLRYDVRPDNSRPTQVYVDADTKLVRKIITETTRGKMTVMLSRYERIGGVSVYGEIHLLENDASIIKLTASDIMANDPLDNKLFEQP